MSHVPRVLIAMVAIAAALVPAAPQAAPPFSDWTTPVTLGAVVTPRGMTPFPSCRRTGSRCTSGGALSRDGHWFFFHSIRPDGFGGYDLMASWRPQTHDDFGWQPAFNLGPVVNSAFNDAGPAYLEDGAHGPQLYFASDRPGGLGGTDLYVSTRTGPGRK